MRYSRYRLRSRTTPELRQLCPRLASTVSGPLRFYRSCVLYSYCLPVYQWSLRPRHLLAVACHCALIVVFLFRPAKVQPWNQLCLWRHVISLTSCYISDVMLYLWRHVISLTSCHISDVMLYLWRHVISLTSCHISDVTAATFRND